MIINDLFNNKKQGMAEAGFPGAPDVEMPPMKPSGDPQRDKLKLEYMDIHREIKSLVDLQYRGTSEEKIQAKARIKQLNDRADEIYAILEPRQPPNEWQKKTYGYDDNWNRVGKGMAEGKKKSDTYHIVNKDGKPANLASYADKESAVKDRDAKHQGAEVRQLGPRGKVKGVSEVSLGDYRKKAMMSRAMAQTDQFFGRDDPKKVAQANQTIAKRERGLARADARIKPYTPPAHDAEKYQRELTAKYPNIDELVAQAEKNRDPYYDRAEGNAYYAGREAEQHYQKLKQIQRVIQGLNESLQTVKEFKPFSKKKATEPVADTTPASQANSGGVKFDLMGRPYKPAPVVAEPEPVAKPVGTAMPINPYQIPISNTNPTPAKPAVAPNTAITTITLPKFNTGAPYTAPADDSELQTIPAPAQLTGPAPVKQLGTNYRDDVIDVDAKVKTQPEKQMALPAPVAKPDYSRGFSGYSNATMTPTASLPPSTKSMMPTNMMPNTAKTPPKPAVSTTAAKNDIIQALKKLGYKTKEAEAAIKGLPPNISTSDAIRQILRGKPTTTTESLTWSASFNPGRSLYRRMKKES